MLGDKLDVVFSKSTLRRCLKEMNYSYKRLRFIPAKEPDQELYKTKKSLIQKCRVKTPPHGDILPSDKKEISQSPPLLRTDRAIFTAISSSINN